MWFFGKRVNQNSTSALPSQLPSSSTVPAELQALYSQKTLGQRLRPMWPFVLPAVSLLVIAGALIVGSLWLHSRNMPRAKNQVAATQQPITGPGTKATPLVTPTPNSTQVTPTPMAAAQTPTAKPAIPNTGPGDMAIVAILAAFSAAAASYVRQLRTQR